MEQEKTIMQKQVDVAHKRPRFSVPPPPLPSTFVRLPGPYPSQTIPIWTRTEIGAAGEHAVITCLRACGYKILRWDTRAPGTTDLEVECCGRISLIQVKASVFPGVSDKLSRAGEDSIRARARRNKY